VNGTSRNGETIDNKDSEVEREEEVHVGAKQQQGDDRDRECKDGIPL